MFSGLEAREFERPEDLVQELERLAGPAEPRPGSPLRRAVTADLGLRAAAVGLALLIWGALWLGSGTAVRTVIVPVEGEGTHDVAVDPHALNLPSGLTIEGLFPERVRIDLTASSTTGRPRNGREAATP